MGGGRGCAPMTAPPVYLMSDRIADMAGAPVVPFPD